MRAKSCSLMMRVIHKDGRKRYYPAVVAKNGQVKPFYCRVGGEAVHFPDGVYYLRYTEAKCKRVYENVGNDVQYALTAKKKREFVIAGAELGIATVPEVRQSPPLYRPEKPDPIEVVTAHLSLGDSSTGRLSVREAFKDYVKTKVTLVGEDSAQGYRYSLGCFLKTFGKTYMDEVGDEDLLKYVVSMRRAKLSDRTIANRCATLSAFMRHYDFAKAIKKSLIPAYTTKIVSAYSVAEIKALFAACNPEELMLFQFFLGAGLREQEVQYASWTDINFSEGVFKVTEKLDVGFKIKDKEEREVPLPSQLITDLKKRFEKRKNQRWIFPTRRGKTDGHMLRTLQGIAFNAGLNCGACINRKGKSCLETGTCSRWGLHRWRKTFATLHHREGVALVDLQKWLGHSELETTQAYLAQDDVRSPEIRKRVDSSFAGVAA